MDNVVYFRYSATVRAAFLEHIGVLRSHEEEDVGVILAGTTCDLRKPMDGRSACECYGRASRIGNTSFGMDHHRRNGHYRDQYDHNTAKKVPVTLVVRKAIKALQGATFSAS